MAATLGSANINAVSLDNIEFSTNALYEGIEISLVNTGLLQENSITFTVGEMGSSTYNAQVMEYNLDDTVMLTSVVLDHPQEYTLSFKPNGSGVMKLLISSLADASDVIGIYGLYTTVTTYTSQNITTTICNNGGDRYRFGFNGQEKTNEIAGVGNHNTALYWEYDTRLGRRWNLDPVDQISISNYACFGNSPIWASDVMGDFDSRREAKQWKKDKGIEGKIKKRNGEWEIIDKNDRHFMHGKGTTRNDAIVKGKKMNNYEKNYQHYLENKASYDKWYSSLEKSGKEVNIVFGGMLAAPVVAVGAVFTSEIWVPAITSSYSKRFLTDFSLNIGKQYISTGNVNGLDFFDAGFSAANPFRKFGFGGRIGMEFINASIDSKLSGTKVVLANKDATSLYTDLVIGLQKQMTREVFNLTGGANFLRDNCIDVGFGKLKYEIKPYINELSK